jgi:tetratricopeptide (TPR) repeat protein
VRTLAEQLRSRGFNTGAAVSSFLLRAESGVAQGFAFFDGEMPEGDDEGAPALEREARLTVDAAERWLQTQNGERFFLFVQLDQPGADAAITRLAQLLKERRLYEKATIVLVGERGAAASDVTLDEASLRVPLMVKQPDGLGAGRRVTSPVQHIDLVPTLLDLVRAPVPSGLRGRSLRSVLDEEDANLADEPIYAEALATFFRVGGAPLFAASNSHFRLVRGGGDDALTALMPLDAAAPETAQHQSLGAWLDRLTGTRAIDAPAPVAARDEDRYALFGFLTGLRPAAAGPALAETDRVAIYRAQVTAARHAGQHNYHTAISVLQDLVRDISAGRSAGTETKVGVPGKAEHPALASAQFQIGRLQAWSGRPERAIEAFKVAAELRPDAVEPLVALADLLIRQGDHQAAELQVERVIALADGAPASGRAAADRAAAYGVATRAALARGRFDVATKYAEAVEATDRRLPMVAYVRGRQQYEAGEYEAAVESLTEAQKALSEHGHALPDLHLILGESFAHRDQYPEAEMQFREELRAFPRNLQAYSSLAMLYRASNRTDDLESVLEDLVAMAPTPEGYAMAARLWAIAGDRTRAEALRAEARTRFRGDPAPALLGQGVPR